MNIKQLYMNRIKQGYTLRASLNENIGMFHYLEGPNHVCSVSELWDAVLTVKRY